MPRGIELNKIEDQIRRIINRKELRDKDLIFEELVNFQIGLPGERFANANELEI